MTIRMDNFASAIGPALWLLHSTRQEAIMPLCLRVSSTHLSKWLSMMSATPQMAARRKSTRPYMRPR